MKAFKKVPIVYTTFLREGVGGDLHQDVAPPCCIEGEAFQVIIQEKSKHCPPLSVGIKRLCVKSVQMC